MALLKIRCLSAPTPELGQTGVSAGQGQGGKPACEVPKRYDLPAVLVAGSPADPCPARPDKDGSSTRLPGRARRCRRRPAGARGGRAGPPRRLDLGVQRQPRREPSRGPLRSPSSASLRDRVQGIALPPGPGRVGDCTRGRRRPVEALCGLLLSGSAFTSCAPDSGSPLVSLHPGASRCLSLVTRLRCPGVMPG